MMYLTGVRNPDVDPHLDAGTLGLLNTPNSAYAIRDGWTWAADNGAFNEATFVGEAKWFAWLETFTDEQKSRCLFATAPDVVGDHEATVTRSKPWLVALRWLGYKAAFVAQDGMTVDNTDWTRFDVLFIGGSTAWKLGPEAKAVIARAKQLGKPVHVGRVNSAKRFQAFAALGCDSADGTFIAYHPTKNLDLVLSWIDHHATQPALFGMENA